MRTILITGATDGIGKATALALAQQGHLVIVHGRPTVKAQDVDDELHAATGSEYLDYVAGDFSRLADVRALANEVIERHPGLDTLINNAGIWMNTRELSADGFELTMAVNHLAPYLLTRLLLPALKLSAPARIVHVSSTVHMRGKIDFDNESEIDPRFDVRAMTIVRRNGDFATLQWRIMLHARGTADQQGHMLALSR